VQKIDAHKHLGMSNLNAGIYTNAFIKPIIEKSCLVHPHFTSLFRFKYEQILLETEIQLYRFSQKLVV
jgi:hypothetical protein